MPLTNLSVAEEALGLSPTERADLVRLLIQSLEDDQRTDEEITADLKKRFEALRSGSDPGLGFNEVFGETG
jgi:putative addiction module component (TIGR02574 family)